MKLSIDHHAPLPLHAQVEALLRRLIRQQPYAQGKLLPEEQSLAQRLAVSRGTVRVAIGRLVDEGLLERRRGVGTRVKASPQHSGLADWQSFRAEMSARGVVVQDFVSDYREWMCDDDTALALELPRRQAVWRLTRLRGWDQTPAVEMVSHFHPRLRLTGDESFTHGLYATLEKRLGVRAMRSEERITAEPADAARASRLAVRRGAPLLVRRRVVRDAGGRVIELAINHYVSERCAYTLELERRT